MFGIKSRRKIKEPEQLQKIPEHVAFVLDGNGRWAAKRSLPRTMGIERVRKSLRKLPRYVMTLE